jgi:hypothetical protein
MIIKVKKETKQRVMAWLFVIQGWKKRRRKKTFDGIFELHWHSTAATQSA